MGKKILIQGFDVDTMLDIIRDVKSQLEGKDVKRDMLDIHEWIGKPKPGIFSALREWDPGVIDFKELAAKGYDFEMIEAAVLACARMREGNDIVISDSREFMEQTVRLFDGIYLVGTTKSLEENYNKELLRLKESGPWETYIMSAVDLPGDKLPGDNVGRIANAVANVALKLMPQNIAAFSDAMDENLPLTNRRPEPGEDFYGLHEKFRFAELKNVFPELMPLRTASPEQKLKQNKPGAKKKVTFEGGKEELAIAPAEDEERDEIEELDDDMKQAIAASLAEQQPHRDQEKILEQDDDEALKLALEMSRAEAKEKLRIEREAQKETRNLFFPVADSEKNLEFPEARPLIKPDSIEKLDKYFHELKDYSLDKDPLFNFGNWESEEIGTALEQQTFAGETEPVERYLETREGQNRVGIGKTEAQLKAQAAADLDRGLEKWAAEGRREQELNEATERAIEKTKTAEKTWEAERASRRANRQKEIELEKALELMEPDEEFLDSDEEEDFAEKFKNAQIERKQPAPNAQVTEKNEKQIEKKDQVRKGPSL